MSSIEGQNLEQVQTSLGRLTIEEDLQKLCRAIVKGEAAVTALEVLSALDTQIQQNEGNKDAVLKLDKARRHYRILKAEIDFAALISGVGKKPAPKRKPIDRPIPQASARPSAPVTKTKTPVSTPKIAPAAIAKQPQPPASSVAKPSTIRRNPVQEPHRQPPHLNNSPEKLSDRAFLQDIISDGIASILANPRDAVYLELGYKVSFSGIARHNQLTSPDEEISEEELVKRVFDFVFEDGFFEKVSARLQQLHAQKDQLQGLNLRLGNYLAQEQKSPEFIAAMIGSIYDFGPDFNKPDRFIDPFTKKLVLAEELAMHLGFSHRPQKNKRGTALLIFGREQMEAYDNRFSNIQYLRELIVSAETLINTNRDTDLLIKEASGRHVSLSVIQEALGVSSTEELAHKLFSAQEVAQAIETRTQHDKEWIMSADQLKVIIKSFARLASLNPLDHQRFSGIGVERIRLALDLPIDESPTQANTRKAIAERIIQAHAQVVEAELQAAIAIETVVLDNNALKLIIGDFKPFFDNYTNANKKFNINDQSVSLTEMARIRGKIFEGALGKEAGQALIIEIFGQAAQDYAIVLEKKREEEAAQAQVGKKAPAKVVDLALTDALVAKPLTKQGCLDLVGTIDQINIACPTHSRSYGKGHTSKSYSLAFIGKSLGVSCFGNVTCTQRINIAIRLFGMQATLDHLKTLTGRHGSTQSKIDHAIVELKALLNQEQ